LSIVLLSAEPEDDPKKLQLHCPQVKCFSVAAGAALAMEDLSKFLQPPARVDQKQTAREL
jgi:hypothetical protein